MYDWSAAEEQIEPRRLVKCIHPRERRFFNAARPHLYRSRSLRSWQILSHYLISTQKWMAILSSPVSFGASFRKKNTFDLFTSLKESHSSETFTEKHLLCALLSSSSWKKNKMRQHIVNFTLSSKISLVHSSNLIIYTLQCSIHHYSFLNMFQLWPCCLGTITNAKLFPNEFF